MDKWMVNWTDHCRAFKARCIAERSRFLAALENSHATSSQTLFDILRNCANSEFGRHYQISNIKTIAKFQDQLPIANYDFFIPWLEQEEQQGGGVFSCSKLVRWLKTSGSTGQSKKIPYTTYWLENHRVPALRVLWANYIHYQPNILAHPHAVLDMQTIRMPSDSFLNGIPWQGITNRNQLLTENDWHPPWYEAPWFTPEAPVDYQQRMYCRLRYFLGENLHAILSINPSTVVALYQNLTDQFDQLITEVENGTLFGEKKFLPNPAMAKQLKKIKSQGSFTLKDIWPNLNLVGCWTSASAKLYLPQLQQYLPDTKILPFMTCGTEGIVTLPIDGHSVTGPLAINQGFYEFLPVDIELDKIISGQIKKRPLLFNQLELNKEYHLIMTQGSGLLRYATGDIYKVIDFYNDVPRIEFSRRWDFCYSFTGEKLTEPQLLMAIDKILEQFNLSGSLFMCCPNWGQPPCYEFLLETKNHNDQHLKDKIEVKLDERLSEINVEYKSKRDSKRLGPVKLTLIPMGLIDKYQEQEKAKSNATQFKYKPLQKTSETIDKILNMVAS